MKVLARGIVSRTSRAHLNTRCGGHMPMAVYGRPSEWVWATAWATATDISVLPVPHSPTMIADRAVFRCLADSRDGQGLSRKRLPQERLKSWRQRIVWPLQRRIHFDDTCPKLLRESSQIFVIGIHGGTPEDGSEHAKKAGFTGRFEG